MWQSITQSISVAVHRPFELIKARSVGGGCINQSYVLTDGEQQYFVKLNRPELLGMFEAEAAGLQEIAATNTIQVPAVITLGMNDTHAYLVLSYIELDGRPQWERMGAELAALHRVHSSSQFGWERSNTIGSTPQINDWSSNWAEFFGQQRLGYQFQLATSKGGKFPLADQLLAQLPEILNHQPSPSIVHGDLWSGNASFDQAGAPVIFDPAVYWGDREVDMAMTELFGGFPPVFYAGYESVYPINPGYQRRKIVYNLYHLINHYNLFGGSYERQVNSVIASLF
jgi:fructosamine-3-kinase